MNTELTQADLSDIGKQIKKLHIRAWEASDIALHRARDAGELLYKARMIVPHGEWGEWLLANCAVEIRQAQKYMTLASHWTEIEQKRPGGAPLSINAACKLITAPKVEQPRPIPPAEPDDTGPQPFACSEGEDDYGTPPNVARCHKCGGEDFFDDGTCRSCPRPDDPEDETPTEIASEAVCEPVEEEATEETPEVGESASSWLNRHMELLIEEWRMEYPDAQPCYATAAFDNVMEDWK